MLQYKKLEFWQIQRKKYPYTVLPIKYLINRVKHVVIATEHAVFNHYILCSISWYHVKVKGDYNIWSGYNRKIASDK